LRGPRGHVVHPSCMTHHASLLSSCAIVRVVRVRVSCVLCASCVVSLTQPVVLIVVDHERRIFGKLGVQRLAQVLFHTSNTVPQENETFSSASEIGQ
jgi:hypothetical protein